MRRRAILASQRFIPRRSKWEFLLVPRHDERRRYFYHHRGGERSSSGRRWFLPGAGANVPSLHRREIRNRRNCIGFRDLIATRVIPRSGGNHAEDPPQSRWMYSRCRFLHAGCARTPAAAFRRPHATIVAARSRSIA